MLQYPAIIKLNKADNVYYVEFPDIEGCFTDGDTLEIALAHAKEAMDGMLSVAVEHDLKLKAPSKIKGKDVYYITPEHTIAFAVLLRLMRERKKMTQKQVAGSLGVSYQVYQRLENPRKANPTLRTIAKLEKVFDSKIISI